MSKVLALDVGEKRMGTALSDESKIVANPLKTLGSKNWKDELKSILAKENIESIVIGLPRKMDGSIGDKAKEVMSFGNKIEDTFKVKVEYEDETATSLEAEKRLKERGINIRDNKGEIDMESAVIILENFLNRTNAE